MVLDPAIVGVHPHRRQAHAGVFDQGVIAAEVDADEDRGRLLAIMGNDQQDVDGRRIGWAEGDPHFAERGLAVERFRILVLDLGANRQRRRQIAVHVILEQLFQLGASLIGPLPLARDALTVEHHERIGQVRLRRQLVGFGKMRLRHGDPRGDERGQQGQESRGREGRAAHGGISEGGSRLVAGLFYTRSPLFARLLIDPAVIAPYGVTEEAHRDLPRCVSPTEGDSSCECVCTGWPLRWSRP